MKTVAFSRVFELGLLLSVLLVQTQSFGTFRPPVGLRCWGNPADIVFVLDSSSSIWGPDFKKQLDFVKYMVDHLDIGMGPDQVRVGVETFSDFPHVHIDLADSRDKASLKARIDRIPRVTGSTNIGDALKTLLSTMFKAESGSRSNVKHVAIVVTDGISQDERATQLAARACRDAAIQLFAIGIGNVKDSELRGIASEPKSKTVFRVANFDALDQIRDDVIQQTCQAVQTLRPVQTTPNPTPTPKTPSDMEACKNKKADVFFLLDSSSSIGIEEFKKEVNVIENIVSRFDISPTKTRVGVAVFGHDMSSFDFTSDKADALDQIRKVKYMGGGTETGKALHYIRTQVFSPSNRWVRPDAERILIVFTDGQSRNYGQTVTEASLLRGESGVKIFVVGIGPQVDQIELKDISSKPSNEFMLTFDTFDILLAKSRLLTYEVCTIDHRKDQLPSDQDVCNATQRTDVVFMVSNNHFGKVKTDRILKASAEVIQRVGGLRGGRGGPFRFGSIFDNCLPKQDKSVGSIVEGSQLVSFNYGSSIAALVRKIRTDSFSTLTWGVGQVGLLFLDHTLDLNDPEIIKEVKRALFKDITLYAVVIGDGVNEQLLQRLFPSEERIIRIYSYDVLTSYLPSQFTKTVCKRSSDRDSTFRPNIS